MALSGLLKQLEVAAVPHGFRSSFRDWAAEETDHPTRGGRGGAGPLGSEPGRGGLRAVRPVRAAAGLMDDWAAYLDGEDEPVAGVRGSTFRNA